MDLFLWLMGDWREVCAMIGTLDRDIEVEDVSVAIVRLENHAMASITNSVLSPRQESYIRLDFQQATVEVNALYHYTNANWRFSQPVGDNSPEVQASWLALTDDIASGHGAQLSEVLDNIERHTIPPVSGRETRRSMEFVASLYKSALTGQPVRRGDITPDDPFYRAMNGLPSTAERI
jgi:predicted dehydrogenase